MGFNSGFKGLNKRSDIVEKENGRISSGISSI
jgi:hypothetical protein